MKITNFRGELTDISARKEAVVSRHAGRHSDVGNQRSAEISVASTDFFVFVLYFYRVVWSKCPKNSLINVEKQLTVGDAWFRYRL